MRTMSEQMANPDDVIPRGGRDIAAIDCRTVEKALAAYRAERGDCPTQRLVA